MILKNFIGQSEQQFKIQYHFCIFDPVIGEEQLYDDASSQALKCIFESSGNFFFLYSIKSFLGLYKYLVDSKLIYNFSSLDNFDIIHLLRSY